MIKESEYRKATEPLQMSKRKEYRSEIHYLQAIHYHSVPISAVSELKRLLQSRDPDRITAYLEKVESREAFERKWLAERAEHYGHRYRQQDHYLSTLFRILGKLFSDRADQFPPRQTVQLSLPLRLNQGPVRSVERDDCMMAFTGQVAEFIYDDYSGASYLDDENIRRVVAFMEAVGFDRRQGFLAALRQWRPRDYAMILFENWSAQINLYAQVEDELREGPLEEMIWTVDEYTWSQYTQLKGPIEWFYGELRAFYAYLKDCLADRRSWILMRLYFV